MLLGTNWKMNKTKTEAEDYVAQLRSHLVENDMAKGALEIFLIPPLTALEVTLRGLSDTNVKVGVQNIHWEDLGPYTGEISPLQAFDAGARIAQIGHSERRNLFCETDESVALKVRGAARTGLTPLVCVGEPAEEKRDGTAHEFVRRQVKKALAHLDAEQAATVWIAYEPVWAIGEGSEAAPRDYVYGMHYMIRTTLVDMFGESVARRVRILYGGSVDKRNAVDYIGKADIDGVFVGRAALNPQTFIHLADAIGAQVAN